MKLLVVNKLLINRGWRLITKTSRLHHWALGDILPEERLVVLPAKSSTPLPLGTLETIMRRAGQTQKRMPWPCALSRIQSVELIVERASGVLWGRVAVEGLFLVVWGSTTASLTTQIHELLAELMAEAVSPPYRSPETLSVDIRYDMIEVWSFLRQIRANYVAELSGIEQHTLNQFMNGTAFPSSEQMVQLQKSLQELSSQLLRLST